MCTACLPPNFSSRRGPQMSMFEQVSSLGYQMSLAVDPCTGGGVRGLGPKPGGGPLYGEIQCIMGNGHMCLPLRTDRQTRLKTSPSPLRWRAVTIRHYY